MLKVNVGVSRKLSKDYNSTGFSLNLEGEICAKLDDPEGIIERVREYYDLAEEALQDQIRRYQELEAQADRETDDPSARPQARHPSSNGNGQQASENRSGFSKPTRENGHHSGSAKGQTEPITPKQVDYIHHLTKRHGLTGKQLESRVVTHVGRPCSIDHLSKAEAGQLIEGLVGGRSHAD
ncbi:hypothetical protein K2X85_12090 [bacterium]|nr:hypothetical protein [bacterium]